MKTLKISQTLTFFLIDSKLIIKKVETFQEKQAKIARKFN